MHLYTAPVPWDFYQPIEVISQNADQDKPPKFPLSDYFITFMLTKHS